MKRKIITTILTIIYILILEEPSINKRISVISNITPPPPQLYNVPNKILLNSTNNNNLYYEKNQKTNINNNNNNNNKNDNILQNHKKTTTSMYNNDENNYNYKSNHHQHHHHHHHHHRNHNSNKYDRHNRHRHHKQNHNKHNQYYHDNPQRHHLHFVHHQQHQQEHQNHHQQENQSHHITIIDNNQQIIDNKFNSNNNKHNNDNELKRNNNSKRSIRHINSYNDEERIEIENQYNMKNINNEKFYDNNNNNNNNNDINNYNNYYDNNNNNNNDDIKEIIENIQKNNDENYDNNENIMIINDKEIENNYENHHNFHQYNNKNNQLQQHNTIDNINSVINCPKCSSSSENINKVHVSQEQLKELRIDFVKRQILEKLRLKDPPQVSAVDYLPQPITEMEYNTVNSKEDLDDYYARTSKKFIILEREYKECAFINKNPAICFSFKIDDVDTDNMDVNQAVLWVYVKPNNNDKMKQTIVVSECEQQMNLKYLPKIKPIAIKSVDVAEGWIKIDIAWPIKKWVGIHELSHLIHITCNSCELESETDGFIALEKQFQPFIVIDTQYRRQRSRQKRSVNCSAGVKECCREKLYISFKEIGWGDWIISPTGYNAYFCRGSCNSIASIASSNNHHSLIIKTLKDKFDRPLELIPCCTAKQFSQLELLFRDSNNTITQKFLPNMIVESCGCM